MKIQIDTKEDSHEEIRHTIRMLKKLIGDEDEPVYSNQPNMFEDGPEQTQADNSGMSAFGNMFGDNSASGDATSASESANETVVDDNNKTYAMPEPEQVPEPVKKEREEVIRIIEY